MQSEVLNSNLFIHWISVDYEAHADYIAVCVYVHECVSSQS